VRWAGIASTCGAFDWEIYDPYGFKEGNKSPKMRGILKECPFQFGVCPPHT